MSFPTNSQTQPFEADEASSHCSAGLSTEVSPQIHEPKSVAMAPPHRSASLSVEASTTAIATRDEGVYHTRYNAHKPFDAHHVDKAMDCQKHPDPNHDNDLQDLTSNSKVHEFSESQPKDKGKDIDRSWLGKDKAVVGVLAKNNAPASTAGLSARQNFLHNDEAEVERVASELLPAEDVYDTSTEDGYPLLASATTNVKSNNTNEAAIPIEDSVDRQLPARLSPQHNTTGRAASSSRNVLGKRRRQADKESEAPGIKRVRGQGWDSQAIKDKKLKQRTLDNIFRGPAGPSQRSTAGAVGQVIAGMTPAVVPQSSAQNASESTSTLNTTDNQATVGEGVDPREPPGL